MTDSMNHHAPTPEFRASLEREITRALRAELQFEVPRESRARRVGMVVGLALGAVVTLTIGLVLGASTGYASAEVVLKERGDTVAPPRPALAMIPIRGALSALGCNAPANPAAASKAVAAQPGIPLVDLPAATTRTSETFGAILGIRQGADGKVLVNDAGRRQLKLFDSTLAMGTVVLDSAPGSSNSYGPRGAPLIPFVGDSSLFVDWNAQTLIVLDSRGQVARGLALPSLREFRSVTTAGSGIDAKGRIVFRAMREMRRGSGPSGLRAFSDAIEYVDSIPIVRVDLELRRVDTIARFARPLMKVTTEKYNDGSSGTVYAVDPLQSVDEWTVLSNGAIAIVRGHDYHVDWIQPDGTLSASPKLPFDWKRLAEDDKQRLADSVRAGQNALLALGYPQAEVRLRFPVPCDGGRAGGGGGTGRSGGSGAPPPVAADCTQMLSGGGVLGPRTMPALPPFVDLTRDGPIADYDPPLAAGGTMADRDGNLWILPRKTTLAKHGELVYDVVTAKGELFERVRLPEGRAIAGFGKGGVVYLTSGERASGFRLERTRLPRRTAGMK